MEKMKEPERIGSKYPLYIKLHISVSIRLFEARISPRRMTDRPRLN